MDLYIWAGEPSWGIPSMELNSLQIMTYIKFSGAPVNIIETTNPQSTPAGMLPCFKCDKGVFTEFSQVTNYLREQNYCCDYDLTAKQCSEVLAYEQLFLSKLYPALTYFWWVDTESFQEVIRKWYYKNIPLPYKLWLPNQLQKKHAAYCDHLFEVEEDKVTIETAIQKSFQECLTSLSYRLSEDDYFFGRNPCTIDALLFPYLLLFLKVNLANSSLQNHVKGCPNLNQYVTRILHKFFPSTAHSEDPFHIHNVKDGPTQNEEKFPNKTRNTFLFCAFALCSMLSYGLGTGIVQIDLGDSTQMDDDESASEELSAYT